MLSTRSQEMLVPRCFQCRCLSVNVLACVAWMLFLWPRMAVSHQQQIDGLNSNSFALSAVRT